MTLFYGLVTAHLVADFMQPAALVKWTKKSIYGLLVHVTAYTFLSAIVLLGYPLWGFWLTILALSHFLIDRAKYHLNDLTKGFEVYLFLLDQLLHILIIALIAFSTGLADLPLSKTAFFIRQIQPFSRFLPFIMGYIVCTFAVSILVYETDRTYAIRHGATTPRLIITFNDRMKGMLERAAATTFLLFNNLFYLFPLAFVVSILQLYKRWHSHSGYRRTLTLEFVISITTSLIIGIVLRSL